MRTSGSMLRLFALTLIYFALIVHPTSVSADVGPKPSMEFIFEFQSDPIPIISGILFECDDDQCTNPEPLPELGPQRFLCNETDCSVVAYSFSDYHYLEIQFQDKTRTSNVFTKKNYSATYRVKVTADELSVTEKRKLFDLSCCMSGMATTLLVEAAIAILFLLSFHLPKGLLGWVPVASLFTLPVVWGIFPLIPLPPYWVTVLSEIFAFSVETAILYFLPGRILSLRQAASLSLVMNSASFLVGWLQT